MFDISFFKTIDPLKQKIVKRQFSIHDALEVKLELENSRNKTPAVFNIETTNICNMKCVMCPRTELMTRATGVLDQDIFIRALNQIRPHDERELEAFWNFIEDKYELTLDNPNENSFYFYIVSKCLILHGYGEPLLDKHIYERVKEATKLEIPTYFSCVPANLTIEKAEKLFESGLTVLKVSIDALDDIGQKKIRGDQNNFSKSFDTILRILELKKSKGYKTLIVPTMIDFSNDSNSKHRHLEFMELWQGKDVFAYVKSQDNRWLYEEDEFMENRSHYEKQYCEFPWTSLSISSEGEVVPCTQDYNVEMSLGNIRENTLEEIWNGERYNSFREWHVKGNFPSGHKCIDRCDQKKLFQYLRPEK